MTQSRARRERPRFRAREFLRDRFAQGIQGWPELVRAMELEGLPWIPSRSQFYVIRKEWRTSRDRDTSGEWSLAADETGRPDLVMRGMAAVIGMTEGRRGHITVAEAGWIVRVASAFPSLESEDPWRIYQLAIRYLDIAESGDAKAMTDEDGMNALLYADARDYFARIFNPAEPIVER